MILDVPASSKMVFCMVEGPKNSTSVSKYLSESGGAEGRFVLLQIIDEETKRLYLNAFGQRYPVSQNGELLEAALPYWEGCPFPAWERETKPDFSQRKRVCLELFQGILEEDIPLKLLPYMSDSSNVCITPGGARMEYFLDFSRRPVLLETREGEKPQALSPVSALALLAFELLNPAAGMTQENALRFPPEYRLLQRRALLNQYNKLEQLVEDVRALPEECVQKALFQMYFKERCSKISIRLVAGLLLVLLGLGAGLCAVLALWPRPEEDAVPNVSGILQIGDQFLSGGMGGEGS